MRLRWITRRLGRASIKKIRVSTEATRGLRRIANVSDTGTALNVVQTEQEEPAFTTTSGRMQIGEFSLYYEQTTPRFETVANETLPGAGLPLVFLHGMAGNHFSWWQQVPHFNAVGYQCITRSAQLRTLTRPR
jgi:pimeloyl-ACP methyl ester carboxylesterase